MLKIYRKITATKRIIEIPIDAIKVGYEDWIEKALKEKKIIEGDIFYIKGTLQIYAIRYFAIGAERTDTNLENKLFDAITEIIKTLKAGTGEL